MFCSSAGWSQLISNLFSSSRVFLIIYFFFSVLLSVLTFFLLHVHHAGGDDGLVSGLAAVGHPGRGSGSPAWMAILCSGWVGDLSARQVMFCVRNIQRI